MPFAHDVRNDRAPADGFAYGVEVAEGAAAALAPFAPALLARGMRAKLEKLERNIEAARPARP